MRLFPTVPGFNGLGFNNTNGVIGYDNYLSLDLNFASKRSLDSKLTYYRSSAATQIGATGLVEWSPENLLQYSEDLTQISWTTSSVSVSSNVTTAPDNTQTADAITANTSGANIRYIIQSISKISINIQYAYSFWCKSIAGCRYLTFSVDDGTGNGFSGGLDTTTGITIGGTVGTGWTFNSVNATQYPNNWWRVGLVGISSSTGLTVRVAVNLADSLTIGYPNATLNIDDGAYIWGAQLERGYQVRDYIKNIGNLPIYYPRFTYDYATGRSLGILVEGTTINLFSRSETFSNTSWIKTRASVIASSVYGPNGIANPVNKLKEDLSVTTTHELNRTIVSTVGYPYAFSIFAKAGERPAIRLDMTDLVTGDVYADYNLLTGVISNVTAGGSWTFPSASIIPLSGGWYRCVLIGTRGAGTSQNCKVQLSDGSTTNYTGDNTSGVYIWGAQLESGPGYSGTISIATSYIPTGASTGQRDAESLTLNDYTNTAMWYNQKQGTFVIDFIPGARNLDQQLIDIDDGTANNTAPSIRYNSTNTIRADWIVDGNIQINSLTAGPLLSGRNNVAFSYALSAGASITANGLTPSNSFTAITAPSAQSSLKLGVPITPINYLNGTIARLRYWNRRLPNSALQTLTQT